MFSLNFISYFFAFFSVCSIWIFDTKKFAATFFSFAIISGYAAGMITLPGVLVATIYILANFIYFKAPIGTVIKITLWAAIFTSAFCLSLSWIGGFNSWKIISEEIISPKGKPYDLILRFDGIVASMGILLFGYSPARKLAQYQVMFRRMLPFCLVVIPMLVIFVVTLKIVKIDPKIPYFWLVWLMSDLIITCVVEETIFRFFVQRAIFRTLASYQFRTQIAILIPSVFYAIYYMPVSTSTYITLVLLSCCYGYVYHITRRIEASIIFHLTINMIHFFLFTYPQVL